jgi:hypothetical protein
MEHPPADYDICPRYRTEFGVGDHSWMHAELRQAFIEAGAKWGGKRILQTKSWIPIQQFRNIGCAVTCADLEHISRSGWGLRAGS